jgi:hypothetical protein
VNTLEEAVGGTWITNGMKGDENARGSRAGNNITLMANSKLGRSFSSREYKSTTDVLYKMEGLRILTTIRLQHAVEKGRTRASAIGITVFDKDFVKQNKS